MTADARADPDRQRKGHHGDQQQVHPGSAAGRRRSAPLAARPEPIAPEAKAGTSGDLGRGNIVIGGGQEGGWDLTVDGVSATPGAPFEQRLWTTLNSPSVEAITEFAVDTNGFKAEFGHAGGGAVSFVSRSGSNRWQGKVFEFYRARLARHHQLLQQGARASEAAARAARLRRRVRRAGHAAEDCTTDATGRSSSPRTRATGTRPPPRRPPPPSRRRRCSTATSPSGATPTAISFRSTTRRPHV